MGDLYSFLDSAGEYIPNFNFMLRVDGMFDVPLKSVRAFTRENEYDYIQEGGLNDYVHLRRKPISKPFTLVCERYIPTQLNDPLSNGTELTLPLMLFVGKNVGGKFDALNAGRYYVFTGAVIMSKEYGGLDAEKSGILTETVTIGYNRMFCITNPSDESPKPMWQMNEDLDPDSEGNTKQLYSKSSKIISQNDMNKKRFVENAVLWEFDEDGTKAGDGEPSAKRLTNRFNDLAEPSKAQMMKNSQQYNFAAENNPNYNGDKTSVRSAQNALYSDKTLGEKIGIHEATKKEMEDAANMFEFTTQNEVAGNEMLSSVRHPETEEPHIDEVRKNATEWKFDGNTKAGNGENHTQNSMVTEHTEAPDGSSTGLGLKEYSKEEMISNAAPVRAFGSIAEEATKPVFTGNAKVWEFNGTDKAGKGTTHGPENEESKSVHMERASLTPFGGVTNPQKEEFIGKAKSSEFGDVPNPEKSDFEENAVSSTFGVVKQPVKDEFTQKAQMHNKVTIEDFLLK